MLTAFKQYLLTLKLSPVSHKLYSSDIRNFLSSLGTDTPTLDQLISASTYTRYLDSLSRGAVAPSVLKRMIASLKQFGTFLALSYSVKNPTMTLGQASSPALSSAQTILDNYIKLFTKYLESEHLSNLTIKSYKSDLTRYLNWATTTIASNKIDALLSQKNIDLYWNHLTQSGSTGSSTIERKSKSLARFKAWYQSSYAHFSAPDNIKESIVTTSESRIAKDGQNATASLSSLTTPVIPAPGKSRFFVKSSNYRSIVFASILLLFTATLSILGYRQFSQDVRLTSAYPSTPVTPNRQLSFQGRLENAAGTPITSATNLTFKLYDAVTSGTQLYSSGACSLTPDSDGVFSTQIGSTCGSAIASTVFTENSNVWLEVTVASEILSPRQPIATVAYALNSETLQGFPLSSTVSAVRNTVVPMNQWGEILVGEQSPRLKGVSGTFQISAPALTLSTATGTNGNITLSPDGTGQVNLNGNTTSTSFFNVSNAQLTTGSLITGTAANNNAGFKLLDLLSGSSPTSKFSVDANGNTTMAGDLTVTGDDIFMNTNTAGMLLIADGTNFNPTAVSGDLTITGAGVTAIGADKITEPMLKSVNGPTDEMCLTYESTVGDFEWQTCGGSGGSSNWRSNLGTLSPLNDTWDLLVGANATASAKAGFLNINSGTPTATVSAGVAGGAFLTATGTLATTAKQSLTLGDVNTGNINIGETTATKTINIGGNTSSAIDTIKIGTNSTAADTITIGNSNASTTLGLTGGTAWSISTSGQATFGGNVSALGAQTTIGAGPAGILDIYSGVLSYKNASTLDLINSSTSALNIEGGLMNFDTTNSRIGIGDTTPLATLTVGSGDLFQVAGATGSILTAGDLTVNGNTVLGNAITDSIDFQARVLQDADLIPITATGTNDLGSSTLPWDNLYASNVDFSGAASTITLKDNTASAFKIVEGANTYLDITTTNNAESFSLNLPVGGATSHTANLFTANIAQTINLGTGTAIDTINIGTGGTAADDINIGGLSTSHTDFTGVLNFAGGTTYFVDASGNAKFLDLIASDTANPGLTVGDGLIGFAKFGGSLIYDNNGDLTLDSDTTKSIVLDDLQITGNDILDSGAISRITLGATTTLTNTTTTLSGTTTLTAASLATLDMAATVGWDVATLNTTSLSSFDTSSALTLGTTTLTLDSNSTIYGGSAANDDLTLQGTSNATNTTSYVLLQPTGGSVGIGTTTPLTTLDVRGTASVSGTLTANGVITSSPNNNLRLQASGANAGNTQNGSIYFLDSNGITRSRLDTTTPVGSSSSSIPYTTEANYTQENMAYAVTLTPSATTGDITLTLGSGNWNTDARIKSGCRVVGNGGEAGLTAAPAASTTINATVSIAFTNTSAISSGSWSLYCTDFNGGVVEIHTTDKTTYVSNLGTFATTSQAQLPAATSEFNTVSTTIGGTSYIYVLGGYNGSSTFSTVYKATIDTSGNVGAFSTASQAQLPATAYRMSSDIATIGGTTYIYVIGNGNGTGSTVYRSTLDASGNVGTFATTSQAQLPAGINSHTANIVNVGGTNYLYVIGGSAGSTVYKATIDTSGNVGTFATTSQAQLPATKSGHATNSATIGGTSYLYVIAGSSSSTVYKATIDTSGNVGTFATTSQAQLPANRSTFNKVNIADIGGTYYLYVLGGFITSSGTSTVYKAQIDTSGNIGTFATTSQAQLPQINYRASNEIITTGGTQYLYLLGGNNSSFATSVISTVYKSTIGPNTGTSYVSTSSYYTTVTAGDQLSTSTWHKINSATTTETLNSQTAYYSFSFDNRTTFAIYDNAGAAWRSIARNNGGTWQYNSNATYASTTWTNATVNSQNAAISEAMSVAANQMTGTTVNALDATDWNLSGGFGTATTTTLDAAVSLYTTATNQIPKVSNISFSYTTSYTTLYVGAVNTTDADLAEYYVSGDKSIEAGDVVSLSNTKLVNDTEQEISTQGVMRKSTTSYDPKLLGVISTNPGVTLGSIDGDTGKMDKRALALSGRVPLKIAPDSSSIKIGDFLTSSSTHPGMAQKATKAGYTIGKSLEDWDAGSTKSKIEVFVNLGFHDPDLALTSTGDLVITSQVADSADSSHGPIYQIIQSLAANTTQIIERIGAFSKIVVANLSAGFISTQSLQVASISPIASGSAVAITGPVTIKPHSDQDASSSPLLEIEGTLDASTISARLAKLGDIQAENIIAKNIVADTISANHIEGLDAKIASLSAGLSESDLTSITTRLKSRLSELALNIPTAADLPVPETLPSTTENTIIEPTPISSDSATLATLSVDMATINNYFAVIGQATITSLDITSQLYISNISSKTGTLALQSDGGIISLAKDTLLVDSVSGQVTVNGDLHITGKITATELNLSKLSILNEDGKDVATIDASGSANLASLTTGMITIASPAESSSSGNIAELIGSTHSNATAGESQLISPNTEITIESPHIKPNSLVYLTPTTNTDNKVLFVKSKETCQQQTSPDQSVSCTPYFTVAIDNPASTDISFNWWIIQLQPSN